MRSSTNEYQYSPLYFAKQLCAIYTLYSSELQLPESAFWGLYALKKSKHVLTQQDICEEMFMPKQTINYAIQHLIKKGFIELGRSVHTPHGKNVCLTERSKEVLQRYFSPLLAAEQNALSKIDTDGQQRFHEISEEYVTQLRIELKQD